MSLPDLELENINSADGGLRRSEVVLLGCLDFLPAVRARILVRFQVQISDADGGLDVPMFANHPAVTITQSDACPPALVTFVFRAQSSVPSSLISDTL